MMLATIRSTSQLRLSAYLVTVAAPFKAAAAAGAGHGETAKGGAGGCHGCDDALFE